MSEAGSEWAAYIEAVNRVEAAKAKRTEGAQ